MVRRRHRWARDRGDRGVVIPRDVATATLSLISSPFLSLLSLFLAFLALFVSVGPDFTVIYDAYPKARVHLLMLPRRKQIAKISALSQLIAWMDILLTRRRWRTGGEEWTTVG